MFAKSSFPVLFLLSFAGIAQCGLFGCWFGEFECANKECVSIFKKCDGSDDCKDGSDELGCNSTIAEPTTTVGLTRTTRQVSTGEVDSRGYHVNTGEDSLLFTRNATVVWPPTRILTAAPDSVLNIPCRVVSCEVDRLNWYKPDGELPRGSFVQGGHLIVPKVHCGDTGPYICYCPDGFVRDYYVVELEVDQTLCLSSTHVTFTQKTLSTTPWTTVTTPSTPTTRRSYSYWSQCENGAPCYQFCCNGTCVSVVEIPRNAFRCRDGSFVLNGSICNGVTDCPDGSDEIGCTTSCTENEFQCGDGSCIPEIQKCDGEPHCGDGTDESNCKGALRPMLVRLPGAGMEIDCADPDKQVKGGHVLQLECTFYGRPFPEVKWKKNDGHVPSKCTSNSKFGHGTLFCPNFQQSDQGAYSCVGENPHGSAESQPETVVKCRQIECEDGFRVRDEHNVESCIKCFCSGRTKSCRNLPSKLVTRTFSFPSTETVMLASADGAVFMPNSSNVNSGSLKPIKYCLMPEDKVQGHGFMMSYGRNLNLPAVNKRTAFLPYAPDVIITGGGIMLTYSLNRIAQDSTRMNVRFWNDNWLHQDKSHASRSDIMGVLSQMEQLFIRCEYEEGVVKHDPFAKVTLESALGSDESDSVSYVEKCSCPIGYDGLSCESCAPGYKRDPVSDTCIQRPIVPMVCPVGKIGERCDECDLKNLYYRHSKNQTCVKTTCNDKGSMGLFPGDNDDCICKEKVTGRDCDTCKFGHFHLDKENPYGCKKCWCSSVTQNCRSSDFLRTTISSSISAWGGFNESNGGNFWLLPPEFSGNLLTSYGGFIRYSIKYQSNVAKQPKPLSVEILGENGDSLRYVNSDRDLSLSETEKTWSVQLEEPHWKDHSNWPVTREKLLVVLSQVKAIYVESPYHLPSGKARLTGVEVDVAEDTSNEILQPSNGEKALKVEICECPVGYDGTSCESCSVGYYRQRGEGSGYVCAKCECDLQYCDPVRGCAVCPKGKYNNNPNPSETPVCLDCPCHGNEESCMKDDYNLVMCFCKPGFHGTQCEIGEGTEEDFQVSMSPVAVLNKRVGTFVTFNCSYVSAEEHRIEFQKNYAGNSPHHTGLFKVENYGWCSTLETNIERNLVSVDCVVRNLGNEVVARVTARVIGTAAEVSKPAIKNCPDEPKTVTENEDVYLHCDTTGSPEPDIKWYRVDQLGNLEAVNTTDGVHTIPSVGLGMNATIFTCVAQNSEGDARCTTLLIVRKRCVLAIQPVNPEVEEGDPIEFICTTASGSTVQWSRTDEPLPLEAEVNGGRLYIPEVTMAHTGEYKCTANDPYGPSVKTTRLTVKIKRIPPTAIIPQSDITVAAGESFVVTCLVTGKPRPRITWTKMDDYLFPGNVRVTNDGEKLQISNANVANTGLYQCRAESFLNATSRILIVVVENPEIIVQPEVVNAKVGDNVTVDCIPLKGEPFTKLSWSTREYWNGESPKRKLRLENIQPEDDGVYTCTAKNIAGVATSSVRITVGTVPKVTLKPSDIMDVVPRDQIDVECFVSGEPTPELKWYKVFSLGGMSMHKVVEPLVGEGKRLTLSVTEDLDSVVCEGRNKVGVTNATLRLNVKSENPVILGMSKRVRIGSRVELDFSHLGGQINCTRKKGSMVGDECYTPKGLEIMNAQVQHSGTYKCTSKTGEMFYTLKVDGFVNQFTKHGMSYLIIPVNVTSQKEFQVEITFKAERQSGFLLMKKKHHAFSMYMKRGKLTVRLRRPSEEVILTTKKSLQLGVWHTAVFNLRHNAELIVYDEEGVAREVVMEPKKFEMNWSVNVEDNLYVGGVKVSERHLPLSPVEAHFEGCISRLIFDHHEYKMTEEAKHSHNVSLCKVCSSGENPCGGDSACFDAPTHYGFVCVCRKDGCRKNCMGRGCETKLNMCEAVKPCGHADNKCLANGNGLRCRCAHGYSGITCSEEEAFEFGLNGDGFVKLPETYLPRNSLEEPEVISIAFTPATQTFGFSALQTSNVLLFSQGYTDNYLRIYVEDDAIVYTYVNQEKTLRVSGPLDFSNEYRVEVTRRNNTATMKINGDEYSDEAPFSTNRVTGDIYIGGDDLDSHSDERTWYYNAQPTYKKFVGCIHEVKINGKRINTLAKEILRRNIQRKCSVDSRIMGAKGDSASTNDDSESLNDDIDILNEEFFN